MSHSPPVPPGNQSPYPLQEAPHEHHAASPPDVAAKRPTQQDEPLVSGAALGVGLAIGLGSAALFAAWLFSGSDKPKAKPAARKPRAKASNTGTRAKPGSRATAGRPRGTTTRRRKTTNDNN